MQQIPPLHQVNQEVQNFDLNNITNEFWALCDDLAQKMRALRSDVFYFCAVCTQTTHDQQIRDNAQLLQTMIENLHKCCLNLSSFKNQHSRELAILKSKRRQICRSPNHIQMQDDYEPTPPSVQSTAV